MRRLPGWARTVLRVAAIAAAVYAGFVIWAIIIITLEGHGQLHP